MKTITKIAFSLLILAAVVTGIVLSMHELEAFFLYGAILVMMGDKSVRDSWIEGR